MTPNVLDHARDYIRDALEKHAGFVDASEVASAVKALFPHVDLQILMNAIIEETIAAGGSVAWGGPVGMNQNNVAQPLTYRPYNAHVLTFRSQDGAPGSAANSNAVSDSASKE